MSIIDAIKRKIQRKHVFTIKMDSAIGTPFASMYSFSPKQYEELLQACRKVFVDYTRPPSRLRFSVGHNHVEIIIGKPVCLCKMHPATCSNYYAIASVCNPKDTYNWKTGAVQSLTNFLDFISASREERGRYYAALFKKYPELKK